MCSSTCSGERSGGRCEISRRSPSCSIRADTTMTTSPPDANNAHQSATTSQPVGNDGLPTMLTNPHRRPPPPAAARIAATTRLGSSGGRRPSRCVVPLINPIGNDPISPRSAANAASPSSDRRHSVKRGLAGGSSGEPQFPWNSSKLRFTTHGRARSHNDSYATRARHRLTQGACRAPSRDFTNHPTFAPNASPAFRIAVTRTVLHDDRGPLQGLDELRRMLLERRLGVLQRFAGNRGRRGRYLLLVHLKGPRPELPAAAAEGPRLRSAHWKS